MPDALLHTKLHVPRTHAALVHRPRLMNRLEAGLRGRLILVSAPAGYGKTTLLSDWIHGRGGATPSPRVAWLSLDAADNDLSRFLGYLIASLQTVDEDIGTELQAVVSESQAPPVEGILTRLISEIEAATEGRGHVEFVLVLDDYHVITAQAVHSALRFMLDHLPAAVQLLIAGRTDPPLPISRLRVQGEITEIRAADLRFTIEEAAAFLNDRMGVGLSPADLAVLGARTEGWIASLQLAALALRGRSDKQAFVAAFTGSHRYLLDYLVDDVMVGLSPAVQTFLRRTSILDRLSAPLCDAVCFAPSETDGTTPSRATLRQLETDNLFLIPLDDERHWYRYHHLFADFLGQRLREEEPNSISALHSRASQWFEEEGTMDDAIEHALAAGDDDRATRLVDSIAASLIVRRNPNGLLKWIDRLPPDLCQSYPMLCVWHAWALEFVGRLDAVEPVLRAAEANRDRVPQLPLPGYVTTVRAYLANQRGDLSGAIDLSQQALDQMDDAPPEKVTLIFQGSAVIWLGVNYRHLGYLDRARKLVVQAASLNRKAGNYYAALATEEQLGDMSMARGQLHRAAEHFRRGLRMVREWSGQEGVGGPLLAAAGPHLGLGTVLYQWNDLAGATYHVQRAVELHEWGGNWARVHGYRLLAYLKHAEGEYEAAYDLLQRATAIQGALRVRQMNMATEPGLEQLRILLSRSQPETAHLLSDVARRIEMQGLRPDHADLPSPVGSASPIDFSSPTGYRQESQYADLARALIAVGRAGEALPLLDRLLQAAQSMERWGDAIRYEVQQALAFHALGDASTALDCLNQALTLAEPEGYVRLFVDEGEPMEELLLAVRQGQTDTSQVYVETLLSAFGAEADYRDPADVPPVSTQDAQRRSILVEALSPRELEVLGLMAEGLRHAQVAEELVISLNTVRHHTRNIYGKLEVHTRAQAIARARELELL